MNTDLIETRTESFFHSAQRLPGKRGAWTAGNHGLGNAGSVAAVTLGHTGFIFLVVFVFLFDSIHRGDGLNRGVLVWIDLPCNFLLALRAYTIDLMRHWV